MWRIIVSDRQSTGWDGPRTMSAVNNPVLSRLFGFSEHFHMSDKLRTSALVDS